MSPLYPLQSLCITGLVLKIHANRIAELHGGLGIFIVPPDWYFRTLGLIPESARLHEA
jgi:hypothetical protein